MEGQQNEYIFVQAAYTVEVRNVTLAAIVDIRQHASDTTSHSLCMCLQTSEAERIGINQVAKVLTAGNDRSADQREPQHSVARYSLA